ncbi:major facilitator superfamily domain-containing protein [Diplogelasinospora grovesii]|uniref:Major facilitator superfamily domain-containing protein n=1 Tax=Diplogelasinospora grovesii TaxID=303347 RepID=A0AAN6S1Y6_9PEZI|nr:major facilitator superfamily domain-containing protein [Diplogelasinospora grovesii]
MASQSSFTISEGDPSSTDVEKEVRTARSTSHIEKKQQQQGVGADTEAQPPYREEDEEYDISSEHDSSHHETESKHEGGGGECGVVSRVLSRAISRTSTKSIGPPPDGGLEAWTAVAAAHLIIMNTWGLINSFGVFQTYYATTLSPHTASDISWIGSIQVFLLFFIGTFTGRLTDAGYFRQVFAAGSMFQVLSIFTMSVASGSYWQLFLAQGVCMGLGNGCLFCPCLATLSTYFSKRRALAIGIAACGSATGGLIFPSMVRQLLPTIGFAWTMRAIGFIQLVTLVISNIFLKPRIQARRTGPLVEWSAFKELEYTFYACGSFFCFLGVYFAFYYLASFSRDIIGVSYVDSLNLLLVLNGVGSFGRLIPNHLADRFGPINVFVPVAGIAGVCVLCWMAVTNVAGLYVWAAFYGAAAGGIQSLFPAGLSSLTTDMKKMGVRMGMVFTINSFATLTGPPIAGAIITASGGRYVGAQAFAGAVLLVGMGFMMAAKVVKGRRIDKGGGWRVKV